MFSALLKSSAIEKILFFLLKNKTCYGSQLKASFGGALSSFQKGLDQLEKGAVIVSYCVGRTRVYQFNPRYPFLKELEELLAKAYTFMPEEIRTRYYEPVVRKRPRKRDKKL